MYDLYSHKIVLRYISESNRYVRPAWLKSHTMNINIEKSLLKKKKQKKKKKNKKKVVPKHNY